MRVPARLKTTPRRAVTPKENMMNIAIGSDHGGVELKAALVGALAGAAKMIDMGPADKTSCDYPDYAAAVAKAAKETGVARI